MVQVLIQAEIDALNRNARDIYDDNHQPDDEDDIASDAKIALEITAENAGLQAIISDGETTIYRDNAGRLVNCWLSGQSSPLIEDGGAGFDDQVGWYTDAEPEGD